MLRRLPAAVVGIVWIASSASILSAQSSIPGYSDLTQPCAPSCGTTCTNYPFQPTNCSTSGSGPARANIVFGGALSSTNMLYCPGGTSTSPRPYALCFFSGPPVKTGTEGSVATNNILSCVPDFKTGFAKCQCQVYNASAFYVDINSILNLGAWSQTRQICGTDGALCKNIAYCDENGNTKSCAKPPCPACPATIAPVCDYVGAQPFDPDKGLYPTKYTAPSRVDLVSAFSFAMGTTTSSGPYKLGSTKCINNGFYAGCMTAPCQYGGDAKSDGSVVTCECPMWQGDYQIGQDPLPPELTCPTNQDWVWSAANSVSN